MLSGLLVVAAAAALTALVSCLTNVSVPVGIFAHRMLIQAAKGC
jgi:hypothetical protein